MAEQDIKSFDIDFTFEDRHRCSSTSPEIKVDTIPQGTKSFQIKLVDLDVTFWNHGGGTVENDGSGIIPEGSLKSGYNGPCPPGGSHRYEFTVSAIDDNGKTLSSGKKMQKFP